MSFVYSNAEPGTGLARGLGQSAAPTQTPRSCFLAYAHSDSSTFDKYANLDLFIAARQCMVVASHFSPWRLAICEDLDFAGLARHEDAESDLDLLFRNNPLKYRIAIPLHSSTLFSRQPEEKVVSRRQISHCRFRKPMNYKLCPRIITRWTRKFLKQDLSHFTRTI